MPNTRRDLRPFASLVWLTFLVYPIVGIVAVPRSPIEYLYSGVLILGFVAMFFWAYFIIPWSSGFDLPLRLPSIIGMIWSYCTFGLLFLLIGWYSVGLLIYAASFAGAQRSFKPSLVAIGISFCTGLGSLIFRQTDPGLSLNLIIFSVVAAMSNHNSYREFHTQRLLQRSQEEVARVAKIAERERIARDLHDLLGHTLSLIVLKSELASRLAQQNQNPQRVTQEIRDVERIARDALQEVRSAVRGYRDAGLEAELENVRLACVAANLKLELFRVPLELSWQNEQALALALREATTNVIRHAKATTLWVSLEPHGKLVHLSVWDDGAGQILEGNGIRGIRERVTALGGKLELNKHNKGFTVYAPQRQAV